MKKWGWIGLCAIILIAGGVYFLTKAKQVKPSPTMPTLPVLTPTTLILPTSTPSLPPHSSPSPFISGAPSGQITCDYQIPPVPNQYGDAKITAVWTSAQIAVCVAANGNSQTLITSDAKTSGTRTDDANWLAANTSYVFTLYNQHAAAPVCSGQILATCQISIH